jgi:hypothetical protein
MNILATIFLLSAAQAGFEAPAARIVRLPAGTPVEVALVATLGSMTSKVGERFALRLAAPIVLNGMQVATDGAPGEGEVIDVAKAGAGGKQAKLNIAARFLDLNGQRVRIRGMTLIGAGKSHVDLATGMLMVPYVGLAAVFVRGGEIEIPAGTRATVRLIEDTDLPVEFSADQRGR